MTPGTVYLLSHGRAFRTFLSPLLLSSGGEEGECSVRSRSATDRTFSGRRIRGSINYSPYAAIVTRPETVSGAASTGVGHLVSCIWVSVCRNMGICVSEHGYLRVKPWVSVKTVRDQGHSKMYHNDLPLEARFHRAKNIKCTSRPFTAANELPVARRPEVLSTSGSAYASDWQAMHMACA